MIEWIPIEQLNKSKLQELENHQLIFYVEQGKMCKREFPEIITGSVSDCDIIFVDHDEADEKFHDENRNLRWHSGWISKITHYAQFNNPWD